MTSISYRPLVGSEIRLVKIKPIEGEDPSVLDVDLVQVELDEELKFYALSYVWGDPEKTLPIRVDGIQVDVTVNLHGALSQLRNAFWVEDMGDLREVSDLVWVDALCINQSDIPEKERQIPRMTDIYGMAHQVMAYLGRAPPEFELDTEIFIRSVLWLPYIDQMDSFRVDFDDEDPFRGIPPDVMEAHLDGMYKLFMSRWPDPMLLAVIELLGHPWFARVWIAQEAILAQDLWFMYQNHFIEFGRLLEALTKVQVVLPDHLRMRYLQHATNAMALSQFMTQDGHKLRSKDAAISLGYALSQLLRATTTHEATRPHDCVYGVLGLANAAKLQDLPPQLLPNYSTPFSEVFHQYIIYVIKATGDLNRLDSSHRRLTGVPSWVPDLRHVGSPTRTPLKSSFVSLSEDGTKLFTQGFRVATISLVFRAAEPTDYEDADYADSFASVHAFTDAILRPASKLLDCTIDVAFGKLRNNRLFTMLDESFQTLSDLTTPQTVGSDEEAARQALCFPLAQELAAGQIFLTENGILGINHRFADDALDTMSEATPDILCVLKGASNPVRLRPTSGGYLYLGTCGTWDEELHLTRPYVWDKELTGPYDEAYFSDKTLEEFVLV